MDFRRLCLRYFITFCALFVLLFLFSCLVIVRAPNRLLIGLQSTNILLCSTSACFTGLCISWLIRSRESNTSQINRSIVECWVYQKLSRLGLWMSLICLGLETSLLWISFGVSVGTIDDIMSYWLLLLQGLPLFILSFVMASAFVSSRKQSGNLFKLVATGSPVISCRHTNCRVAKDASYTAKSSRIHSNVSEAPDHEQQSESQDVARSPSMLASQASARNFTSSNFDSPRRAFRVSSVVSLLPPLPSFPSLLSPVSTQGKFQTHQAPKLPCTPFKPTPNKVFSLRTSGSSNSLGTNSSGTLPNFARRPSTKRSSRAGSISSRRTSSQGSDTTRRSRLSIVWTIDEVDEVSDEGDKIPPVPPLPKSEEITAAIQKRKQDVEKKISEIETSSEAQKNTAFTEDDGGKESSVSGSTSSSTRFKAGKARAVASNICRNSSIKLSKAANLISYSPSVKRRSDKHVLQRETPTYKEEPSHSLGSFVFEHEVESYPANKYRPIGLGLNFCGYETGEDQFDKVVRDVVGSY